MEFLTNDKLLIVGAGGMIGSNMVQSALMLGLTPNICLYDIYEPGVHGVFDEIQQCAFPGVNVTYTVNPEEAFTGAKYIISSGGAPDGDYVVLKFARWAFEKFRGVEDSLGTSMKAVGEVMAIGKTFKETFQKAIRGLENGRAGLGFAKDFNKKSADELCEMLKVASSERYFQLYEAIRKGVSLEKLSEITHVKDYFLQQMKELVELEEEMLKNIGSVPSDELLIQAKKDGFSDKYLSKILKVSEKAIRDRRQRQLLLF